MSFDYKKEYKEFYMPPKKPSIVEVPSMNYIAVRGKGNPNDENGEYKESIGLLYGIAFTIKMSYKGEHKIDGYFEYVVPPLEGFWWQEGVDGIDYVHKENFSFISLIRLPDFVTKADFDWAVSEAIKKKKTDFSKVEFFTYNEGLCVQCMHVGSYDDEPAMVILLYGQMVAMSVATEKSSRAMELLITSAKPINMMFGKVLAACMAGLVQLVAIFGSALVFYNVNKSYWGDNGIIDSIFNIPPELFVYMLVFFLLGFLIYAFLYGAISSTVSKLEDINTAVQPVTFLFIIVFMVVMFSMSSGSVDNILMQICSYIPFTSPMAMFTRIAMSTVPWYEIAISIGILVASTFGIGILSAKIYRVGVLMYGTSPKIGNIIKAVWKA